jgi:hypothetical protein
LQLGPQRHSNLPCLVDYQPPLPKKACA